MSDLAEIADRIAEGLLDERDWLLEREQRLGDIGELAWAFALGGEAASPYESVTVENDGEEDEDEEEDAPDEDDDYYFEYVELR